MPRLVSIEVDLLNDFMHPKGALYIAGAKEILKYVKILSQTLDEANITRINAIDYHFKTDPELKSNGGPFPEHAMSFGTGSDIIAENKGTHTLYKLFNKLNSYNNKYTYTAETIQNIIKDKPQEKIFVIEKQEYDMFSNPVAETLLKELGATDAIVYGVATDFCVKAAVLGAQSRNIQCHVVAEAIRGIAKKSVDEAMVEMKEAGAKFILLTEAIKIIKKYPNV